jgi:hypothetical protein
MIKRMHLMAVEGRAILDGARDESDLAKAVFASPQANSDANNAVPPVSSAPK